MWHDDGDQEAFSVFIACQILRANQLLEAEQCKPYFNVTPSCHGTSVVPIRRIRQINSRISPSIFSAS